VEELQGRLENEITLRKKKEKELKDLNEIFEQVRTSNKQRIKSQTERFEELIEIADGYYKRLELYQWAFEGYLSNVRTNRASQKGATGE